MKSLKRNQVIVFVIALMLVSAGYLSYTANNGAITTSAELNSIDYAGIGDAKLVNSNAVDQTNTNSESITTNNEESDNNKNTDNKNENRE